MQNAVCVLSNSSEIVRISSLGGPLHLGLVCNTPLSFVSPLVPLWLERLPSSESHPPVGKARGVSQGEGDK